MAAILEAESLCFAYAAGRDILSGVTLSFAPGTVSAVLGPNGSGKTTLIRLLSGEYKPNAGSVRLDGRDVSSLSPRQVAARMALVPQKTDITFDFTAFDIVMMGRNARMKRFQREQAADIDAARSAMERLGVDQLMHRRVSELSGGEWQRVVIARALAQEAEIILLDEPVSNLDLKYQIDVMRIVRALAHDEGKTCVAVLHDVNLAAHYADRICMLKDGRLAADGAPAEALTPERVWEVYGVRAKVEHRTDGLTIVPMYDMGDD